MKEMVIRKSLNKMAGLTLLETMFGVAIGALILIAAVIFYTSTKNSQNVSKTVTDMNSIVAQASAYIAPGQSALDALSTGDAVATLQSVNYLPADMSDPWGQAYTATVAANHAVTGGGVLGNKDIAATAATITITVTGLAYGDNNCKAVTQAVSANATPSTSGTCDFTYPI